MFTKFTLISVLFVLSQAQTFYCGADHMAYVWNCQTILDNWPLDDNTQYSDSNLSKCDTMEVGNQVMHDTVRTCVAAENDSCIITISGTKNQGQFPPIVKGSDIKAFVQRAINECTNDNVLSASIFLSQGAVSVATCSDYNLCQI